MKEDPADKITAQGRTWTLHDWKFGLFGWAPSIFGLVISLCFAAEIFSGDPIMLYWPLAFLGWFCVGLILHEMAHFMAGYALGLRPWRISVGRGSLFLKKQFRSFEFVVRTIPFSGVVYPFWLKLPKHEEWRLMAMTAAAPLTNAFLFVLARLFAGPMLATPIMLANLVLLIWSVFPVSYFFYGRLDRNDGLQMWEIFQRTRGKSVPASAGATEFIGPPWQWIVNNVEVEELLEHYTEALKMPELPNADRRMALDAYATTVLTYGAGRFLPLADTYSKELYDGSPAELTVMGTRGSVLIEIGELNTGMEMLRSVMTQSTNALDCSISAAFLGLAELKKGNASAAREWLRVSAEHDPTCFAMLRIKALLESTGAPTASKN